MPIQETQETGVWSLDWKDPLEWKDPLQASCLENPLDRGAWRATVPGDVVSWTRLSERTHVIGDVLCAILVGLRLLKRAVLSVSAAALASEKACGEAGGRGPRKREAGPGASSALYRPCRRWESWVQPVLSSFFGKRIKVEEKLGILVEGLLQLRAAKARLL